MGQLWLSECPRRLYLIRAGYAIMVVLALLLLHKISKVYYQHESNDRQNKQRTSNHARYGCKLSADQAQNREMWGFTFPFSEKRYNFLAMNLSPSANFLNSEYDIPQRR